MSWRHVAGLPEDGVDGLTFPRAKPGPLRTPRPRVRGVPTWPHEIRRDRAEGEAQWGERHEPQSPLHAFAAQTASMVGGTGAVRAWGGGTAGVNALPGIPTSHSLVTCGPRLGFNTLTSQAGRAAKQPWWRRGGGSSFFFFLRKVILSLFHFDVAVLFCSSSSTFDFR